MNDREVTHVTGVPKTFLCKIPYQTAGNKAVHVTATSSDEVTAWAVTLCLLEAGGNSTELSGSVLLLLMRSACIASLVSSVGKDVKVRRII